MHDERSARSTSGKTSGETTTGTTTGENPAMTAPKPDALILAAGEGRRMGGPKATLRWGEKTFVEHVVLLALDAGCPRVTVVSGAAPLDEVATSLAAGGVRDVTWVHNPDFVRGVGTSLRRGLEHVLTRRNDPRHEVAPVGNGERGTHVLAPGVLVLTVDRPHLRLDTVKALLAAAAAAPSAVVQPSHGGRRGHPIVWPLDLAHALLHLRDDETPRDLLARADVAARRLSFETDDPAIFEDLTTPEDLSRLP
jgi:molybdenum cofactor cytidylyltransferase